MSNKNTPNKKTSTTKVAAKKKTTQKKVAQKKAAPVKSVAKKAAAAQANSSSAAPVKKKAGRPPKSIVPKAASTLVVPTGVELPSATSTTAATGSVADSVVMSLSWQKAAAKPTKSQRFKNFFRLSGRKNKS